MPLPVSTNVTVDIFRHGNGPGGTPAVAALAAYLTPKGRSTLTTPDFTHVLYVPAGTDIRDNFQPGTLGAGPSADVVYYPADGAGNPYTVVLVREFFLGTNLDHLEVLLIKGLVTAGLNNGGSMVSIMHNGTWVATRQNLNFIDGTNVTATVADNKTSQRVDVTLNGTVEVQQGGTLKGTRPTINFIAGTNVTVTVADNSGSNRVDVTIAASGGGGGSGTVFAGNVTGAGMSGSQNSPVSIEFVPVNFITAASLGYNVAMYWAGQYTTDGGQPVMQFTVYGLTFGWSNSNPSTFQTGDSPPRTVTVQNGLITNVA